MNRISVDTLNQNWLFKYKLYHIPFWCVYHYFWFTIAVANPVAAAKSMFFSAYSVKILSYVIVQAFLVYFNLYYLMPRFMKKGHLTEYVIYLSLTIIGASSLINGGYYLSAFFAGCSVKKMFGVDPGNFMSFYNTSFPSTVASTTLGMSIKLTKNWLQTQHRQQLLEKEKLERNLNSLNTSLILISCSTASTLYSFSFIKTRAWHLLRSLNFPNCCGINYTNATTTRFT
jgi:two-component system LytT family sensor kinase